MARRTRSFEPNASKTVTLPSGQVAHELHVEQSRRLARSFSEVRPDVWCFVGNGLSNQSFIDAPEGIIAIDTGESIEEMNEALAELRKVSVWIPGRLWGITRTYSHALQKLLA